MPVGQLGSHKGQVVNQQAMIQSTSGVLHCLPPYGLFPHLSRIGMGAAHGSSLVRPRQQALSSCSSLQLHDAAELDPVKVNAKCLHEGNVNRKERVKFDSHARIHMSQTGTPLRMWSKQFFQDGRQSGVAGARGHGHNRTGLPAPAWIRIAAGWRKSIPHSTPQTH